MVVSPLTGELVPVEQMGEHMRVSLIDPKWREQREAMLAKLRGTTRAGDDEISANLVSLARHRPDVFGAPLILKKKKLFFFGIGGLWARAGHTAFARD